LNELDDSDALKPKFIDLEDLYLEEDELSLRSDDENNFSNDDQEIPPVVSLIQEDILKEVFSFCRSIFSL
jgi:hypothetical protein